MRWGREIPLPSLPTAPAVPLPVSQHPSDGCPVLGHARGDVSGRGQVSRRLQIPASSTAQPAEGASSFLAQFKLADFSPSTGMMAGGTSEPPTSRLVLPWHLEEDPTQKHEEDATRLLPLLQLTGSHRYSTSKSCSNPTTIYQKLSRA